jgi:hypothetical protein
VSCYSNTNAITAIRQGCYPALSGWALSAITHTHTHLWEEAEEDLTHTEENAMWSWNRETFEDAGFKSWSDTTVSQRMLVATRIWMKHGVNSLLEPQEGVDPCQHLGFSQQYLFLTPGLQNCERLHSYCFCLFVFVFGGTGVLVSCLLGKCFITWATPPVLFSVECFRDRVSKTIWWADLEPWSSWSASVVARIIGVSLWCPA